jgi:hypothetical protein
MKNHLSTAFFGTKDFNKFFESMQGALNQVSPWGVFTGDNLFAFGRNLSFLDDTAFMDAFNRSAETPVEKAIIWRTYVLCWAARRALRIDGDFVECGCYKGTSARIVADYVRLGETGRRFFLYDLFEHSADMPHHGMPEHSAGLYSSVASRFADLANVRVIRGRVPDSFAEGRPDRIAFLHVDMNNAEAEVAALDHLFDGVAPGAAVVFDDYGWLAYRRQKDALDGFFAARGLQVLELPTGQGLVIA